MYRNTSFPCLLLFLFLIVFSACNGTEETSSADTTAMPLPPAGAPVLDTAAMVQPLPADSQHLKMPVQPLPDTGLMPVKKSESGVTPL